MAATLSTLCALAAAAGGCQLIAGLGGEEPLGGGGGTTGSPTAGGGGSGTGLTGSCTPAETGTCYSGPKETVDKGACKAGQSTCGADGMWGTCEGEVVPRPERCGVAGDEDCNEIDCTVWMKTLPGEAYGEAVAVDPKGNVYAAVLYAAGVDFGDGKPLVPIGNTDVALLKLDKDGTLLWKKPIPAAGDQQILSLVVDADGTIAIGGISNGMIDFGSGKIEPGAFVAKLDTDGKALWARSGQGESNLAVSHVAIDSKGNVFFGGSGGSADFGAGLLTAGDPQSFFVGKLAAADGEPKWIKITKGGVTEVLSGMAVDPSDSLVVAGSWSGMYLGLASAQEAAPNDMYNCCGNLAPFLLRLDPDGAMSDSSMLAGYQSELSVSIASMAVDKFGVTTMAGSFTGIADFDMVLDAGSNSGAFLLHDQTSGFMQWSQALLFGDGYIETNDVAVDGDDKIVVSGRYSGIVSLGGETLPEGDSPVFVAKLDPEGQLLWHRAYKLGDGQIEEMAAGSLENETVLIGTFYGTADFGTGVVTGSQGAFLVKLGQ